MLHIHEESARCLLCHDAPCGAKVARAIRAARFDNLVLAAKLFNELTEDELQQAQSADKDCGFGERSQRSEFSHQLPEGRIAFIGNKFL